MKVLLQVKNLRTQFRTELGVINAVNGISYEVYEREILGLVGESGCGKSVSQLSTLQLIPNPPGKIVSGEVFFEGQDLIKLTANGNEMRSIRGGKISMIFQEPMTSLNPVLTVGNQIGEMLELHLKMNKRASRKRAAELLELVGIPDAKQRLGSYPHQLSGGMRQRVMIAIALSCNPRLIIADEPTTALDVTTQAQLLELMKNMVDRFNTSLIIVTHNLGIVARYANRIFVMYAGSIVESGSAKEVFSNPRHPYTIGLLKSVPRLDEARDRHLSSIEGMPPNLANMPDVCAFSYRCTYRNRCKSRTFPEMRLVSDKHYIRCHIDIERESE
jgi:oligopeptide/dipeptide ABC transporter ATP-binding protein